MDIPGGGLPYQRKPTPTPLRQGLLAGLLKPDAAVYIDNRAGYKRIRYGKEYGSGYVVRHAYLSASCCAIQVVGTIGADHLRGGLVWQPGLARHYKPPVLIPEPHLVCHVALPAFVTVVTAIVHGLVALLPGVKPGFGVCFCRFGYFHVHVFFHCGAT